MEVPETITVDEVQKALRIIAAIGEAIKELKSAPAGHLYAAVMGTLSLEQFEKCIDRLVAIKLVRRDPNHMLTWIGDD